MPRSLPDIALRTENGPRATGGAGRSAQPAPEAYLPGEVIADRYRLIRELGRGGMGVVWSADSLVLGIEVALKLIQGGVPGGGVGSRMAREAHAAARLAHSALVRVFDFGWTNRGDPFLVMELVRGESLADQLARRGRMPAIQAVRTVLSIADGLRLAHDSGIVHRDLKPANIFLATDGLGRIQPKLLDFGIAKVDAPPAAQGKITQMGVVLGSPEYMSPEQALGNEDIDGRTDVWSLSVVLYEMVAGALPFGGPNYNALMQAILKDEPPPLPTLCAGDDALWLVVQRGLAKRREQRWADMTEFGEALALWLFEHGVKEDLAGNSIRAVWLDGVLSGLRIEVPLSNAPDVEEPTARTRYSKLRVPPQPHRILPEGTSGQAQSRQSSKERLRIATRWALPLAIAAVIASALLGWPPRTKARRPQGPAAIQPAISTAAPRPEVVQHRPQSTQRPEVAQIPVRAPTDQHDRPAAATAPKPAKAARPVQRRRSPAAKRPVDFGF
ncbi:MAG: serine/threonine protein kinase [Polyangiaceae bacterium]|nr:serine/threonine protein kinase [Polyangiaceae bacterium]